MAHDALTYWVVVAACAIAVFTDVRAHRIPNTLTMALAILVFGLRLLQGPAAFGLSLGIFATVCAIGAVAFSMKMLGGGDVKLAAAAAAGLGLPDGVSFLLYTALSGGVLAIIFAVATGKLRQTLAALGVLARSFSAPFPAIQSGVRMPYATAIAAGVLLTGASDSFAPMLRIIQ